MTEAEQVATAKIARAELMKRVLITVTAVLVVVVVALMVLVLSQGRIVLNEVREDTQRGREASEANNRVLALIEDCTNPEGECAKRGRDQTGDAVASINEITLYAAACADRPGDQTLAEIKRCVEDLITASADFTPGP